MVSTRAIVPQSARSTFEEGRCRQGLVDREQGDEEDVADDYAIDPEHVGQPAVTGDAIIEERSQHGTCSSGGEAWAPPQCAG